MQPINLTLEERERWAYANGDVHAAELLAAADDAEHRACELQNDVDDLADQLRRDPSRDD